MSGLTTGLAFFLGLCAAILAGVLLHRRLPERQLTPETRDVVRRGASLVAVLAAAMLGLMTVSLKNGFDDADRQVRRMASQLVELDRVLRRAEPVAAPERALLLAFTRELIPETFTDLPSVGAPDHADPDLLLDRIADGLAALQPATQEQRTSVERAQRLLRYVMQTRWSILETGARSVQPWMMVVMGFWLVLTFGCLALAAPPNFVAIGALTLCAAAVGATMFLIVDLDDAFSGMIAVSAEPLQAALHALQL